MLAPYWWCISGEFDPGWVVAQVAASEGGGSAELVVRSDRFDASFVDGRKDLSIARPGFLPEFLDVIGGFWVQLLGTAANPHSVPGLLDTLARGVDWFAPIEQLPPSVKVAIRNIDGAYWEVAGEEVLIQNIESNLRGARRAHVARRFGSGDDAARQGNRKRPT